ncbi:NAD dependent epimerase dehydratase [Fusarium agapanthi]|uniref:NAD dependent epimerase dehydratase n=1 Tax=Fusarium agapanthi TaxID=1803897 RepID=A0A9P5BJP0_9HYPO|nr:NAD dependent epimerase dehydratase [Fusarium agapanthi]
MIVSTTENTLDYALHSNNIVTLLRTLSISSLANGVHPLVIFTAGSKDYGVVPHFADDPDLTPHDEYSHLHPPPFAIPRVQNMPKLSQNYDAFSAVLVRPTNVYGRASSYYGACFQVGSRAASNKHSNQQVLIVPTQPNWIFHALYIDDCAETYVAIASAPRETVEGEVFNISSQHFETAEKILGAIARECGLAGGIRYVDLKDLKPDEDSSLAMVVGFPQWTCSQKLRRVTGWTDRRLPFSDAIHVYRLAYEAAAHSRDENMEKIGRTTGAIMTTIQSPAL